MPVPPPLLQDCIPGEHLLYTFCYSVEFHPRTCFKQDKNQKKKYKELSYLNPIVPPWIYGTTLPMSKRTTGSPLLGPLSST